MSNNQDKTNGLNALSDRLKKRMAEPVEKKPQVEQTVALPSTEPALIDLTLNGKQVKAKAGETILELARRLRIHIPTLCHDPRLPADGACRLCVVEVEGSNRLLTSCETRVAPDMVVKTNSAKVRQARQVMLDLLFSNHPDDCLTCKDSGHCKLQNYCYEYGVVRGSYRDFGRKIEPKDKTNPFYDYDPEKCILCGQCVRVCADLQCTDAITLEGRGEATRVRTPNRVGLEHSRCVSCGNCVAVCPTGALMPKRQPDRWFGTKKTRTTCSYCGVGCQMHLITKDGKLVGVEPVQGAEPNDGMLCVKGRFSWNFVQHPDRLKTPLIRKNGKLEEASWEEALNLVASKLRETKDTYGPDSIAGFSSARATNEDNYLFQKMLRAVIGTNNVDHCARL